jgi:hypothetical protein
MRRLRSQTQRDPHRSASPLSSIPRLAPSMDLFCVPQQTGLSNVSEHKTSGPKELEGVL